jgi:hypothetical protein
MKSIPACTATLFVGALLLLPTQVLAADESTDALEANCRIEGESGGLEGKDLEEFIRDCVQEMSKLKLNNS